MKIEQIEYKITHSDNLSRTGVISLKNNKRIETPINWVGLSVAESIDFQLNAFKETKVTSFMSNVYDLKYQDKKGVRDKLINKLVNAGLHHKVDSGGFQLMKQEITGKKNFNLTPDIAYEVQSRLQCDIGVILDVPLGTSNNIKENYKKIDRTIQNFERLLEIYDKELDTFSILPVVHGHNSEMLDYAINKIQKFIGEIPKALGIGSLVPMVKSMQNSGQTGGKKNFINLLISLRKKLPDTFIHAFGIGGTMAYLAFLCGVDSIDSTGWILKASRGVIQLPGISDRFLKKKPHGRPFLINNRKIRGSTKKTNEIEMFMKCKCPACISYCRNGSWSEKDWYLKRNDFDQYTEESRMKRVVHNLWLYQNELNLMKKHIIEKKFLEFIGMRLENSIYKSLYLYIKKKIDQDQTQIKDFIK